MSWSIHWWATTRKICTNGTVALLAEVKAQCELSLLFKFYLSSNPLLSLSSKIKTFFHKLITTNLQIQKCTNNLIITFIKLYIEKSKIPAKMEELRAHSILLKFSRFVTFSTIHQGFNQLNKFFGVVRLRGRYPIGYHREL